MARIITPRRQPGKSKRVVGDKINNGWILAKMIEDGGSTEMRRWIVKCSNGHDIKRYESEMVKMPSCALCK